MHRHWAQYGPPVYVSVAAYLGLGKPPPTAGAAPEEQGDINDLLDLFGSGGMIG